jgi:interferon gamma-inducible protein 30
MNLQKNFLQDYRNFVSYICKAYKGTDAPQSCNQVSHLSTVREVEAKSVCVRERVVPSLEKIRSTIASWMSQMNLVGAI